MLGTPIRRLVHAALDSPIDEKTLIEDRCGGVKGICGAEERPAIWVDYVADLGDGFDSTYAIAYSIGKKELHLKNVEGEELVLPRADCLIMGGDEVYPDASREDYEARMQRPYRLAFPVDKRTGASRPPAFLIPGNHDWYDGLTLFLAKFCTGDKANNLGSWRLPQSRSYFAIHLARNWWIWGFDSQLLEDIDKPQKDYFAAVAKQMDPNAKVIICASVPTWLGGGLEAIDKAARDRFYQGLEYIAEVLLERSGGAKVPLVLSGALHHYSRYKSRESSTNFITSGGGGAFLHPTHFLLPDTIEKVKWGQISQTLEIGRDSADETKKAVYPSHEKSRRLALGNLLFWKTNPDFCLQVLGPLYSVCALAMLAWSGYGETGGSGDLLSRFWNQLWVLLQTPVFAAILIGLPALFIWAADMKSKKRKRIVAGLQALLHVAVILFATAFWSVAIMFAGQQLIERSGKFGYILAPFDQIAYMLFLLLGMVLLGFVGGFIYGSYLAAASWFWGDEPNNAFSAMRLDSYRHFIRLKIESNRLTIYPIGIDEAPKRSDWKINENFDEQNLNRDIPAILPTVDIGQHLIEGEIVIEMDHVAPLRSKN